MAKTNFQRRLEEKLKEAVDKRIDFLAGGGPNDYPQYQGSVGFLSGLKEAIRLCEEIESESD